jgi:hypothetical protein
MKLNRRKNALARLKAQIKSGVKTVKGKPALGELPKIKLTDSDVKRINREIEILEKRV